MSEEFKPFTHITGPDEPDRLSFVPRWFLTTPQQVARIQGCFSGYQIEATKFGKRHGSVTEALCCETMGLCGEAGEVADHIKKHLGHDQPLDVLKIAKELGDVLWYVQKMCTTLGLDMADVAAMNIQKLSERHPTGRFDPSYHRAGETESERERLYERPDGTPTTDPIGNSPLPRKEDKCATCGWTFAEHFASVASCSSFKMSTLNDPAYLEQMRQSEDKAAQAVRQVRAENDRPSYRYDANDPDLRDRG